MTYDATLLHHLSGRPGRERRASGPVDFPSRLARFDAYLEVAERAAARTRSKYRYYLVRFYADTGLDPTDGLAEDDVIVYLASLPSRGAVRGDVLRALKAWGRCSKASGGTDPTARLKIPRSSARPAELIPPEAVRALLQAAFRREARRGWTFLLAASTGARVGSLVEIRPTDVAGGYLHLRVAKGGRTYTVPLNRPAAKAVEHLSGSDPLVGVSDERVRQWMWQASEEAGLCEVLWHPHQLRHYFGTQLARVTDPDTWRRAMGHADLSQYPRYVARDDERLREAVEAL